MTDAKKAAMLVNDGMMFACAACDHMQAAHDKGMKTCGKSCKTPLSGDVSLIHTRLTLDRDRIGPFPMYQGDMDMHLDKVCFLCGDDSSVKFKYFDHDRVLSICIGCIMRHDKSGVSKFWPNNPGPVMGDIIIVSSGGIK